jgi:hypothetical protein
MNQQEKNKLEEAIKQTDAIFRLEGFEPTEENRIVREAVINGRVTYDQVIKERIEFISKNKSSDGFINTRNWARV